MQFLPVMSLLTLNFVSYLIWSVCWGLVGESLEDSSTRTDVQGYNSPMVQRQHKTPVTDMQQDTNLVDNIENSYDELVTREHLNPKPIINIVNRPASTFQNQYSLKTSPRQDYTDQLHSVNKYPKIMYNNKEHSATHFNKNNRMTLLGGKSYPEPFRRVIVHSSIPNTRSHAHEDNVHFLNSQELRARNKLHSIKLSPGDNRKSNLHTRKSQSHTSVVINAAPVGKTKTRKKIKKYNSYSSGRRKFPIMHEKSKPRKTYNPNSSIQDQGYQIPSLVPTKNQQEFRFNEIYDKRNKLWNTQEKWLFTQNRSRASTIFDRSSTDITTSRRRTLVSVIRESIFKKDHVTLIKNVIAQSDSAGEFASDIPGTGAAYMVIGMSDDIMDDISEGVADVSLLESDNLYFSNEETRRNKREITNLIIEGKLTRS